MAKKESLSYLQICNNAKNKKFAPIYILMGEESYFIDLISNCVIENALSEDERDFNFMTFYGIESDVRDIISNCKRYPVMSQYQVILVKEAQLLKEPDVLQFYAKDPMESTILIICNKSGNFKGTETLKIAKASNEIIVFESKKITDKEIGASILGYVKEKGCKIDVKAVAMLKDYIGNDIERLSSEIDKLTLVLSKDKNEITPELIEKNIGISKDYNNFELENAISERNLAKSLRIVKYFQQNPKSNPTVLTTSLLFSFFSNLLLIHTCKDKSEQGLMNQVETKSPYRLRKFMEATRFYSASSCFKSIGYLREFDVKSKGVGSRQNEYDLLEELIYKVINS